MSYFVFNKVSSEDLGLIVLERIIRPTWGQSVTETELAGGTKNLMQLKPAYPNQEIVIRTASTSVNLANLHKIYSTLNGFGTLWLSDYPDEYLNVFLKPIVPEAKALYASELPIYATIRPFAYAVSPTILDLTSATSYVEVENNGSVFSAPEIRFVPTGDEVVINLNGAEFSVKNLSAIGSQSLIGKEVVIDSEVYITYFVGDDGLKWQIGDHTYGNYPFLHTGKNYIMHKKNVSSMKINVRERFL